MGKHISFEVEGGNQGSFKGGKEGPPGSSKPDDQIDKGRDKHQKGDKPRKSNDKFNRFGKIDKDNESGHEDSMEEGLEQLEQHTTAPSDSIPIAAFHPTIGLVSVTSDALGKEEQMIEK